MASSVTSAKSPYSCIQIRVPRCTRRCTLNYSSLLYVLAVSSVWSSGPRPSRSCLARNEYPHSVLVASSTCASDSALGSSEHGMAFHFTQDGNSSSYAATASCLLIWLNDTTYVLATAFTEPLYRVSSQNSLLITRTKILRCAAKQLQVLRDRHAVLVQLGSRLRNRQRQAR
jgi:hypothetical protein